MVAYAAMSKPTDAPQTFDEFWDYYVGEHAKPLTRWFHFAGTSAAMACVANAVRRRNPAWLGVALVAGYGPAWASHFFIEGNKPATFKYPLWSLLSDFRMWDLMRRGLMDAEVARVLQHREAAAAAEPGEEPVAPEAAPVPTRVMN